MPHKLGVHRDRAEPAHCIHLNIVKRSNSSTPVAAVIEYIMRLSLLVLLLVGANSAKHNNAWDSEKEYHYILEGRSLTGLPDISSQYSGILMRGVLKIQPKTEQTVLAKLSKVELAPIHTQLPNGWDSEIPEDIQDWQPLATSGKPCVVKLQRGVIKELIFDKDVPTWEVNIHKSALSQLQIDTQGENMILSRNNQPADEANGNAMFKTMEDSVGGNCEVLYDISPLARPLAEQRLEYLPGKEFQSEGELFEIMKTKDYGNCQQRVAVHFGIPGNFDFEPGSAENGEFLSKSSISEITLTGNLKTFTVHSSLTTEKVILSPNIHDSKSGVVASRVNLTLSKVYPKLNPWPAPTNLESVGNLAYTYEQPFSPEGNDRNPGEPTLNQRFQDEELQTDMSSEDQHKDHFDDSSADSSDESGDNVGHLELSDDVKKYYLQPTPTMNEPPQYPILPLFIGNKGKAFSNSDDFDLLTKAKKLAIEIGIDVQNPDTIPQEQTLEKFTILIGVLRTMNIQQLREMQEDLHKPSAGTDEDEEGQKIVMNTWVAFRDAIASTGTGPALVLVTEWIKENKLDTLEIMSVVSTLSKAAKEPTPAYINAFFKLATELEARREDNPKTAKTQQSLRDDAISTTAILAFTELLRYAQVNRRAAHNRFAIHAFGSFTPKNKDALLRDYFPYLIEKLEQGIEENSARATVYIRALGNVAHPKVISIFERYLEGTKPSTVYHREMMVIALDKLAVQNRKAIQGIAYRIYQNTGESFKIRGIAVFLLMKTQPPLAMLQRLAKFTNQDVSKHVNSIVKSLIESASELHDEESQEFARNARTARTFLTPEIYGNEYSAGYGIDNYLKELNIHYATEIEWIDAEDSAIPQGIYHCFNTGYGSFRAPKAETGIMVTSVRDFYKTLRSLFKNFVGEDKDQPNTTKRGASPTEAIVDLLDIEGRNKEKFEFFFLSRDEYSSSYFMVGEDLLSPIPQEYIKLAAESLKSGKDFNMMRLQNFEFTVGFPTATGIPFVYNFQIPRLRKLSGKIQAITNPDFSQDPAGTLQKMDAAIDLRVVFSQKAQSHFGFVTPFDGQQYVSGVDRNLQVHIPISTKINYDAPNNQVRVKIEPINKNEESELFHYSTVPFTSRQDIEDLKPTSSVNRPGLLVMKQEVEDSTIITGRKTRGWSFKITESKPEGSVSALETLIDQDRAPETILFPMARREVKYYAIDVHDVPSSSSEQAVNVVFGWDTMSKNEPSLNSHRWASKPEVSEPLDKKSGSPARRNEMMNEALKDLPTADAIAVDIAIETPGQESANYILTTAAANSKVDGKYKALFYVSIDDGDTQRGPVEVCATAQGSSPRLPPFDSSKIKKEELKNSLHVKFGVGKNCSNGVQSDLLASQWQSPEFRKSMKKNQKKYEAMGIPPTFMDRAHVILRNAKDDLDDEWQKHPKNIIRSKARKNSALNKFISSDSSPRDDTYISLDIDVEPDTKRALFNLKAPMMNIDVVHDAELTQSMIPLFSAQSEESYESRNLKKVGRKGSTHRLSSPESVCLLDKNYVHTFDGVEYPLNITKCWYVAVTSAPEQDSKSSKPAIKSDKQASVTIRKDEFEESKREVSLSLGEDKIELTKPAIEIAVKLNKKPINLSNGAHFIKEGGENELEIIKLSSEAVRIESEKYGIKITFDGYRLQIKVADKYRDSVRGLCGNFDSEPSNDLLTPHNRLSPKPQDFAALYVLPIEECQSIPADLREEEKYLPADKPRPNNVVSDREAGRTTHSGKWGSPDSLTGGSKKKHMTVFRTKIVSVDDQTCFSVRPLPACAPGAKPLRVKTKLVPVYCLPNGESAKRLSDRINLGANPDFSQKSASMKVRLEIPQHCLAAV